MYARTSLKTDYARESDYEDSGFKIKCWANYRTKCNEDVFFYTDQKCFGIEYKSNFTHEFEFYIFGINALNLLMYSLNLAVLLLQFFRIYILLRIGS